MTVHPAVHVAAGMPKEIHFFDRYFQQEWRDADIEQYHRLFPRPEQRLIGEWTPEYMAYPWCGPLLAAACPSARLIVSLRDPVERYHSGWVFEQRRHAPAVGPIALTAFARGLYCNQLSWILKHFSRANLLVLQHEACLADPEGQLRGTYRFLGLDDTYLPRGLTDPVKAVYEKSPLDARLRRVLTEAYESDVVSLSELFPHLDLSLWPNFTHLTGG